MPEPQRTSIPTVLGWLSITFGGAGWVWTAMLAVGEWLILGHRLADGTPAWVFGAMSTWLFVTGVGQVDRRRWARRSAVAWAVAALATLAAFAAWAFAALWNADAKARHMHRGEDAFFIILLLLVLAAYPILTLRFMMSRRGKAAMNR